MHWLLWYCVRTRLRGSWPIRTRLCRIPWLWLPRLRHGRDWRSAVLQSRRRLLRGPLLLRLEAGTLGTAPRSKNLDSWPVCGEIIKGLRKLTREVCRRPLTRPNSAATLNGARGKRRDMDGKPKEVSERERANHSVEQTQSPSRPRNFASKSAFMRAISGSKFRST